MKLVLGVVALVGGVWIGRELGSGSGAIALFITLLALVLAWWCRSALRMAALCLACCAGGCAVMQRAQNGLDHNPLTALGATRALATVHGTLADDPKASTGSARVVVRATQVELRDGTRIDGGGRRLVVRATAGTAMRLASLRAGDTVELDGAFTELSRYNQRLWREHIVGEFRARTLLAYRSPGPGIVALANALRATVLRGLVSLPSPQRGLAVGFLLGDTSELSAPDVARYRASGLSHLLAVSGANLAFVTACVAPFLRRFGLTVRCLGAATVVVIFVVMTRGEPSVLRAAAMALLSLLALRNGRTVSSVRCLALASGVLVVIDPFLVFRPGFQLSVAATAGLVVGSQPIARCLPGPRVLRDAIATPLAAQLGVLPVALATFGAVPLIGLPANLVAAPMAGPVTMAGIVTGLVGGLLRDPLPGLATALQYPTALLISGVHAVATIAARMPGYVDGRFVVAISVVVAALAVALRQRAPGAPRIRAGVAR
ncbi:MAG: ComEC/Rec2 family competence protein [Acidimicrobiia bacterium]